MIDLDHTAFLNTVSQLQALKNGRKITVPLIRVGLSKERKSLLSHLDSICKVNLAKVSAGEEIPAGTPSEVSKFYRELVLMRFGKDSEDKQYAGGAIEKLYFDQGQKPGDQITPNDYTNPNWFSLYRVLMAHDEKTKRPRFSEESIGGVFELLGKQQFYDDPHLLHLMIFICHQYEHEEANALLNGLKTIIKEQPNAFSKICKTGTIRTVMQNYENEELKTIVKALLLFIGKTQLKDKADELLQKMAETFDAKNLKKALITLANVLSKSSKLSPSMIGTLFKADADKFFKVLKILNPAKSIYLSTDAQGIMAMACERFKLDQLVKPAHRLAGLRLSNDFERKLKHKLEDTEFMKNFLCQKMSTQELTDNFHQEENRDEKLFILLLIACQEHGNAALEEISKILSIAQVGFDGIDTNRILDDLGSYLPYSIKKLYDVDLLLSGESTDKELERAYIALFSAAELYDMGVSENLSDQRRALKRHDNKQSSY